MITAKEAYALKIENIPQSEDLENDKLSILEVEIKYAAISLEEFILIPADYLNETTKNFLSSLGYQLTYASDKKERKLIISFKKLVPWEYEDTATKINIR